MHHPEVALRSSKAQDMFENPDLVVDRKSAYFFVQLKYSIHVRTADIFGARRYNLLRLIYVVTYETP